MTRHSLTRSLRSNVALAASGLIAIACAPADRVEDEALTPSRNVVTVDPAALPLYTTTEELRITSDESSREGGDRTVNYGALALLADGSIVLKQLRSPTIQVFDSAGRFVHSFQRRGDGPGEFQSINQIATVGNDIVAFGNRRDVRVFRARGELRFQLRLLR